MRYLINDLIIYDTELKMLMNVNFMEDSVELTPGAVAILLDYFISHPHIVLDKREIGEKAFAGSPYSGSESNVNKSLSILRRSFRDVGEDGNIISTMPSLGVVFKASVKAYEDTNCLSPEQNISTKHNLKRLLCFMSLASIIVAIVSVFVMQPLQVESCKIISRGDQILFEEAIKMMPEINHCSSPGVIINGVPKKYEASINHSLIARCDESSQRCLNIIKK